MSVPLKTLAALGWYRDGAFRDSTHPEAITRGDERGFELKLHEREPDAPLSPFYMMLRTKDNPEKPGPLTPETVATSAAALYQLARKHRLDFSCICGLPNAGNPFARDLLTVSLWNEGNTSLLHLQKEQQDGKRRVVGPPEGRFQSGQRVLVVDDLITEGDTKLEGIKVLEEAGLVVQDLVVLLDRQQGGSQLLEEHGYTVHALFTLRELLEFYVCEQRITTKIRESILQYANLA